jgi:thioredoxin-like negative regulator of GroEL
LHDAIFGIQWLQGSYMIQRFTAFSIKLAVAACLALAAAGVWQAGRSFAAAQAMEWNDAQIRWRSFAEGMREAKETGKPVLAVFYARWCPHCRGYSRLFRDPEIVELSRTLVMVKVNGDRQPQIDARYKPDGDYFPRTMVLTPDGRIVRSLHGGSPEFRHFLDYRSTGELVRMMKGAAALK